jgi:hypothetical protein
MRSRPNQITRLDRAWITGGSKNIQPGILDISDPIDGDLCQIRVRWFSPTIRSLLDVMMRNLVSDD